MGDPYRDGLERALVVRRTRPPRRAPWAGLIAGVGASVALVPGVPYQLAAVFAITVGLLSFAVIGVLRGQDARRTLATLPFPVEIIGDMGVESPRPLRGVEIQFASAPAGPERDEVAAPWSAAGLGVRFEGEVLVLTGWEWLTNDLLQLAWFLDRIGRAVHARHPIARVLAHQASVPAPSL